MARVKNSGHNQPDLILFKISVGKLSAAILELLHFISSAVSKDHIKKLKNDYNFLQGINNA